MKRSIFAVALLAVIASVVQVPVADAAKKVVVRKGPKRTTVVVKKGFPIRRKMPVVVVRAPRVKFTVAPAVYLKPVVWRATVVSLPAKTHLVWEDSDVIGRDEGWTEFGLNVNNRGKKLFMKIDGRAQINFAEVVFANGDAQVVDFHNKDRKSGVYSLLNFKDGRKVSHVRMVAKSRTKNSTITVYMAK